MNKKQEYRDFIVELAKLFRPHTYVEIGARFGYVFNEVSKIAERSVAVDLVDMGKIIERPGVEKYRMTSQLFACSEVANDLEIDLLFIDADHRYEAVMNDFNSFAPKVKKHTGIILLHDTFPVKPDLLSQERCGDAWRAAKDIKRYLGYEIVTLPGPWAGLSIARRTEGSHGWMDK